MATKVKIELKNSHLTKTQFPAKDDGQNWMDKIQIKFRPNLSLDENTLEFDLRNADPAIAILLRRTIMNDTKAAAIEKVGIYYNDSVISDEILSHRLGLVPIKAETSKLVPMKRGDEMDSENTLVFKLDVTCSLKKGVAVEDLDILAEGDKFEKNVVFSGDLEWVPQKEQLDKFGENGVGCLFKDIVLAKLRPGQSIKLEAFCQLGTAKDHAKFSNVSTAHYRMKTKVVFKNPITGKRAEKIAKCCKNIFGIKNSELVLLNEDECSLCRNCLSEGGDDISMQCRTNDFLFEIESLGLKSPEKLIFESLETIEEKCHNFLTNLEQLNKPFSD
ncbi:hypothetical protein MHBO_002768 [Bonamia ostreae]|uniref:DNA-directed RNA polymerase RpoA/D/Rpb3-type domain-containing protein n=1 Tax=Bonamia ostreae TaxID=126728 RepID=A0ABV2APD8_9EUKA